MNIEFTDEQLDFILKYQDYSGSDTVQHAIMNAISIAFDNSEPEEQGEEEEHKGGDAMQIGSPEYPLQ